MSLLFTVMVLLLFSFFLLPFSQPGFFFFTLCFLKFLARILINCYMCKSYQESDRGWKLEISDCRSRVLPPLNCSILAKIFLLGVIGYLLTFFFFLFITLNLSICRYTICQKVFFFSCKLGWWSDVLTLIYEEKIYWIQLKVWFRGLTTAELI